MKLFYQITKYNIENNKVKTYRKIKSKSFVQAFLSYLYCTVANTTTVLVKGITNTQRTIGSSNFGHLIISAGGGSGNTTIMGNPQQVASSHNIGIVVGTGDTAVASTDYALQTQITYGVTSGKLESNANTWTDVSVSAPNASFTINRIFRNSSGGNITIKEIGIYTESEYTQTWLFCVVRDVLDVPVTMSNGDYLKVTYTFQITA